MEKSLVDVDVSSSEAGCRLLETVRAYSRRRLDESGEAAEAQQRHAEFFLGLAVQAFPHLRETIGSTMLAMVRTEYEQALAALRRRIPTPAFSAAWAEGRARPLDEAIAFALDHEERTLGQSTRLSPQSSVLSLRYPDGLSPRGVEVLQLIAAGHSNNEIAAELVLSIRTVGRHITTLYGKIGARSRVDATNYALQHGLTGPAP